MIKFYLLRSLRDIIGHVILIGLPVVLITVFTLIYQNQFEVDSMMATHVAIMFALMFTIFGGAIGFETLHEDFFTAKKDRLRASPKEPYQFVFVILLSSVIVGTLQSVLVLLYSHFVLGAEYTQFHLIILIFILAVIFAQSLGLILLFLFKKVNTAQTTITIYAIFASFTSGLFSELPDNVLFNTLYKYGSSFALAQRAIHGIMESDSTKIITGLIPLFITAALLTVLIIPLSKKVRA